jgi:hypothetical protein
LSLAVVSLAQSLKLVEAERPLPPLSWHAASTTSTLPFVPKLLLPAEIHPVSSLKDIISDRSFPHLLKTMVEIFGSCVLKVQCCQRCTD